jgi:hypothetical protein
MFGVIISPQNLQVDSMHFLRKSHTIIRQVMDVGWLHCWGSLDFMHILKIDETINRCSSHKTIITMTEILRNFFLMFIVRTLKKETFKDFIGENV